MWQNPSLFFCILITLIAEVMVNKNSKYFWALSLVLHIHGLYTSMYDFISTSKIPSERHGCCLLFTNLDTKAENHEDTDSWWHSNRCILYKKHSFSSEPWLLTTSLLFSTYFFVVFIVIVTLCFLANKLNFCHHKPLVHCVGLLHGKNGAKCNAQQCLR